MSTVAGNPSEKEPISQYGSASSADSPYKATFHGPPIGSSWEHVGGMQIHDALWVRGDLAYTYSPYDLEGGHVKLARGLVSLSSKDDPRASLFPLFTRTTTQRLQGPIQFILKLVEQWGLQRDDARILLGFDDTDGPRVEAVLSGIKELQGRDANDRIACLYHIRQTLNLLFQDLHVENQWLRESHDLLDGRSPMELLLSGPMEDLLLLREYVDIASGR